MNIYIYYMYTYYILYVVWYSQLFQNFPQFIVIHTVKGFGIVNKAEIDVFLELSCFFHDPEDLPDPGIEPRSVALQADALPSELLGKPSKDLV